jgi:polyhydroxybutyrate depolymerase
MLPGAWMSRPTPPPAHDLPGALAALAMAAAVLGVLALHAQTRADSGPGPVERTMRHGGRQRTYLVHDFGRGTAPAPVVIVLHGGGGNSANAVRMTGFDRIAARDGIIAVYPDGTSRMPRMGMLTWNAGHCCASAMEANVDDVGFIGAIIDALVSNGRADPSRVYVTGMSNGAMMAHRLGRELSTRLAAIAPVVGAVFGDEPPPRAPVPAFIIVGAEDEIVPPGGGPLQVRALLGRTSADRDVAPAIAQATYWVRHNGCGEPTRTQAKTASRMEWRRCASGAPVVYQSVAGNGHAWPGGEPGREGAAQPTRDFDASAAMWEFFKTQARRR